MLLRSGMEESSLGHVMLPGQSNVGLNAFAQFLLFMSSFISYLFLYRPSRFVCTRQLPLTDDNVLELFLFAEMYDIECVKNPCADYLLVQQLDPDTCCRLLTLASNINAIALQVVFEQELWSVN